MWNETFKVDLKTLCVRCSESRTRNHFGMDIWLADAIAPRYLCLFSFLFILHVLWKVRMVANGFSLFKKEAEDCKTLPVPTMSLAIPVQILSKKNDGGDPEMPKRVVVLSGSMDEKLVLTINSNWRKLDLQTSWKICAKSCTNSS